MTTVTEIKKFRLIHRMTILFLASEVYVPPIFFQL
jgi:hypothetical protein